MLLIPAAHINLVIARLDKLSRNEDVQEKLKAPECGWDLIVCDEAHKMSARVVRRRAPVDTLLECS
jgi:superfamily II DNA or RNA helicase